MSPQRRVVRRICVVRREIPRPVWRARRRVRMPAEKARHSSSQQVKHRVWKSPGSASSDRSGTSTKLGMWSTRSQTVHRSSIFSFGKKNKKKKIARDSNPGTSWRCSGMVHPSTRALPGSEVAAFRRKNFTVRRFLFSCVLMRESGEGGDTITIYQFTNLPIYQCCAPLSYCISSPDLFRTEFLYERVLMGALLFFLLFYIAMSVYGGPMCVCVCKGG